MVHQNMTVSIYNYSTVSSTGACVYNIILGVHIASDLYIVSLYIYIHEHWHS